jgi:hypothetical protein
VLTGTPAFVHIAHSDSVTALLPHRKTTLGEAFTLALILAKQEQAQRGECLACRAVARCTYHLAMAEEPYHREC